MTEINESSDIQGIVDAVRHRHIARFSMILKKGRLTWLLVADGGSARIFRVQSHPFEVIRDPIASFSGEHAATAGLNNPEGRVFQRHTQPTHGLDHHGDSHRLEKKRFVQGVAEALRFAVQEREFQDLIVVAPPKALGDLRGALGPHLLDRICLEIRGDWTKFDGPQIGTHLKPFVMPAA